MQRWLCAACVAVLLVPVVPVQGVVEESGVDGDAVEIRVAVYTSVVEDYAAEVERALGDGWVDGGTRYEITSGVIGRRQVLGHGTPALDTESFDVLVVPGSGRPYVDAADPRWRAAVRGFVADGGGYVGICGGANLASMGFREQWNVNALLNVSTLGIANVYVNDQQLEEWQYLWKANWEMGMPPVDVAILDSGHPIFAGWSGQRRSMRYGGGPGMYPADGDCAMCGPVVPLAIYVEEPMEVAPLHFWRWRGGWEIAANVTTDVQGQYAAVASTFGDGRVALFGPHPEKPTWFGGHVEEFPVRPRMGPFTWFVYNWSNGTLSSPSYNWWMLRRAVVWAAGGVTSPLSAAPRGWLSVHGRVVLPLPSDVVVGYARRARERWRG
ncbi:MAG: BPL-N domain-containing protein [Thermoplasmatota archaeon]